MFTEEQIFAEIRKTFNHPVCVDKLREAKFAETIEEAAQIIIMDTEYWDGMFDIPDDACEKADLLGEYLDQQQAEFDADQYHRGLDTLADMN